MNEQKFPDIKSSSIAEKAETEPKERNLEKELLNLLGSKNLSKEKIIETADKMKMKVVTLGLRIVSKAQNRDEFISYIKQVEKSKIQTDAGLEEVIFSFFEKIQRPEKVEQEIQAPEVSTTPVAPIITPVKDVQPVAIPEVIPASQAAENITNPERKNWWEVKRETEVMAVEDLDGSMETFEKHVKELGVAKKDASGHWQWTGENKKLVFLGDILGDRKMDGMKITSIIGNLSEQAQKKDGQVDFLCGNHEQEFIDFLLHSLAKDTDFAKINARHFTDQAIGIWELTRFDTDPNSKLRKIEPLIKNGDEKGMVSQNFKNRKDELWVELAEKIPKILANMRTSPEGRKILEDICRIKIAVIYDDTLFCHTDPTTKMINDLTSNNNIPARALEINKIFQENISKILFQSGEENDDFKKIKDIYLHADNREYFVEKESFVKCYNSLMNRVLADLYKNNILKPSSLLKKYLDKYKLDGENWDIGGIDLTRSVKINNIDRSVLQKSIDEWKMEYNFKGDYQDIVHTVINTLKNKNIDQFLDAESLLIKKISDLNSPDKLVDKVKNSGINTIIHGHSPRTRTDNRFYDGNGLIIVSPHADFSKGLDINKGLSVIRQNGKIDLIVKKFRESKISKI